MIVTYKDLFDKELNEPAVCIVGTKVEPPAWRKIGFKLGEEFKKAGLIKVDGEVFAKARKTDYTLAKHGIGHDLVLSINKDYTDLNSPAIDAIIEVTIGPKNIDRLIKLLVNYRVSCLPIFWMPTLLRRHEERITDIKDSNA